MFRCNRIWFTLTWVVQEREGISRSGEGAYLDNLPLPLQLHREPTLAGMPGTLIALERREEISSKCLPKSSFSLFLDTSSP